MEQGHLLHQGLVKAAAKGKKGKGLYYRVVYGTPRAVFGFPWPFPYGPMTLEMLTCSATVKRDRFNEL